MNWTSFKGSGDSLIVISTECSWIAFVVSNYESIAILTFWMDFILKNDIDSLISLERTIWVDTHTRTHLPCKWICMPCLTCNKYEYVHIKIPYDWKSRSIYPGDQPISRSVKYVKIRFLSINKRIKKVAKFFVKIKFSTCCVLLPMRSVFSRCSSSVFVDCSMRSFPSLLPNTINKIHAFFWGAHLFLNNIIHSAVVAVTREL